MLDQADKALKRKMYKHAQDLYKICLQRGEDVALSYTGLSISSYHLREYQNAKDYALKAIENQSDLPDAHLILAYIFARNGLLLESEKEVSKALILSPDRSDILSFAGGLFVALDRDQEAREILHKAVKMNPNDWLAHYNLGLVFLRENRLKESLREYLSSFRLRKSFSTFARILIVGLNVYLKISLVVFLFLIMSAFVLRSQALMMILTIPIILVGLLVVYQRNLRGLLIILSGIIPLVLIYLINR